MARIPLTPYEGPVTRRFVHLRPGAVRARADGTFSIVYEPVLDYGPDGTIVAEYSNPYGLDRTARASSRDHVGHEVLVKDAPLVRWLARIRCSDSVVATFSTEGRGEVLEAVHPDVDAARSVSPAPVLASPEPDTFGELSPFVRAARSFMEGTAWPSWFEAACLNAHPPTIKPSVGMCRLSSAVLLPMLLEAFPDGDWAVDGGHPSVLYERSMGGQFKASSKGLDGGMWDRDRLAWDGHYWVVGKHEGADVIVDVAADQYGWDATVVTTGLDTRYRGNYRAGTLKADLSKASIRAFVSRTVETWMASDAKSEFDVERAVSTPCP